MINFGVGATHLIDIVGKLLILRILITIVFMVTTPMEHIDSLFVSVLCNSIDVLAWGSFLVVIGLNILGLGNEWRRRGTESNCDAMKDRFMPWRLDHIFHALRENHHAWRSTTRQFPQCESREESLVEMSQLAPSNHTGPSPVVSETILDRGDTAKAAVKLMSIIHSKDL
jgi:hypothetical protein